MISNIKNGLARVIFIWLKQRFIYEYKFIYLVINGALKEEKATSIQEMHQQLLPLCLEIKSRHKVQVCSKL